MSLVISLSSEREVIARPSETVTLPATIKIDRIEDIPDDKKVFVFVRGLGRILLDDLSGNNYDTPKEWNNASVISAVKSYIDKLQA